MILGCLGLLKTNPNKVNNSLMPGQHARLKKQSQFQISIYLERTELKSEFRFFHKFKTGFDTLDFVNSIFANSRGEKKIRKLCNKLNKRKNTDCKHLSFWPLIKIFIGRTIQLTNEIHLGGFISLLILPF